MIHITSLSKKQKSEKGFELYCNVFIASNKQELSDTLSKTCDHLIENRKLTISKYFQERKIKRYQNCQQALELNNSKLYWKFLKTSNAQNRIDSVFITSTTTSRKLLSFNPTNVLNEIKKTFQEKFNSTQLLVITSHGSAALIINNFRYRKF